MAESAKQWSEGDCELYRQLAQIALPAHELQRVSFVETLAAGQDVLKRL